MVLSEEKEMDVIMNICDAFPDTEIVTEGEPPIRAEEIGPCARCARPTRLYGAYGSPLCPECG